MIEELTRIIENPITDPGRWGLPDSVTGRVLVATWFEDGQRITSVIAPETAAMVLEAGAADPEATVGVRGELVEWVAVGWPEEWAGVPPWMPVYPKAG